MELYKKLEEHILSIITPELESKYFVVAEYFGEGTTKGPILGGVSKDGFGDTVLIFALNDDRFPETKDFETAKEYYESDKVFKVYHLTEGLKVMFSHKMLAGCTGNDCPELQDALMNWWTAWCNYARDFYSAADIKKNQSELADALKQAVDKKSRQH